MVETDTHFIWKKGEKFQLSEHFHSTEFDCKGDPNGVQQMASKALLKMIEQIRVQFGKPLKLTSGFRSVLYNNELIQRGFKAATNSQHLKGEAADLSPYNLADMAKLETICSKYSKAIGVDKTFIHVDTRTDKVRRWTY